MIRSFHLELPAWVDRLDPVDAGDRDERMRFAIRLASRNVAEATGGPFGAAIFDLDEQALIGVGVNLVVPSHSAVAHAEIVAISFAGLAVGSFDLAAGGRRLELVSTTEPCAMCLGAIPWSGVASLAFGARDADARAAGFDEGDKPPDWPSLLRRRGIEVHADVLRTEAAAVLTDYVTAGGIIYNGGRGGDNA